MAIHRAKKEKDFLLIDNAILRDPKLSLKAKGLLAFMLSRPDDWSFSVKGLSKFCRDGPDSVRSAVAELEKHGYLVRTKTRSHGRYQDVVYDIYERPIPVQEKPTQEKTEKGFLIWKKRPYLIKNYQVMIYLLQNLSMIHLSIRMDR